MELGGVAACPLREELMLAEKADGGEKGLSTGLPSKGVGTEDIGGMPWDGS